jgi:hypothetical protein
VATSLAEMGDHDRFLAVAWFHPNQPRARKNTDANRNCVNDKIAEARMSTGNRKLSKLDTGAKYYRSSAQ